VIFGAFSQDKANDAKIACLSMIEVSIIENQVISYYAVNGTGSLNLPVMTGC